MVGRIKTTRTTARFRALARSCGVIVALLSASIICAPAQNAPATPASALAPSGAAPLVSKACQTGSSALASEESPLRNVAAALAKRKTLRILTFGAAPGRIGRHGDYTDVIETMLQDALKGVDVIMINRGISGELAADAAARMKNEVALEEPDLVLWQVGTNDALAYVPVDEFTEAVRDQIEWLKAHKVDLVLVGLQFAPPMRRDAHYVNIREALRRLAAKENVIVIRFYEAMQILDRSPRGRSEPIADQFERSEAGYNCLAQYVARVITLAVFAKNIPKRPPANRATPPAAQQKDQTPK
jgi:lysophospholipase L1-like esterase